MSDPSSVFLYYIDVDIPLSWNDIGRKVGSYSLGHYHDDLYQEFGIPLPSEIAVSVRKRRAEYLAGRLLAKDLLHDHGIEHYDLGFNRHRYPQWPSSVVGSISHSADIVACVCVSKNEYNGIGIDIETTFDEKTKKDIWELVFDPSEQKLVEMTGEQTLLYSTLVFSAKESLFKTLYPSVGSYFDFSAARVLDVDTAHASLTIVLTQPLGKRHQEGDRFVVKYCTHNNMIMTLVTY